MASAGPRRGGLIEGINVTPLVDITLVLLIIFIVTAKIVVTPAVPLDLPRAAQSEAVQTVFSVVLPKDGTLQVDGVVLDQAQFETRMRSAIQADPELRAVIQADRALAHGRVMSVLDAMKAVGIARVAFAAVRPEAGERVTP